MFVGSGEALIIVALLGLFVLPMLITALVLVAARRDTRRAGEPDVPAASSNPGA